MQPAAIYKPQVQIDSVSVGDYEATLADFSWEDAQRYIHWLESERMNTAHDAINLHVAAGPGAQIALR